MTVITHNHPQIILKLRKAKTKLTTHEQRVMVLLLKNIKNEKSKTSSNDKSDRVFTSKLERNNE